MTQQQFHKTAVLSIRATNFIVAAVFAITTCICAGINPAYAQILAQTQVQAQVQKVGLELILAVDVSRSIDGDEYSLQMKGYADAFRNPAVLDAISSQPGGIAIALVQWGDKEKQRTALPWRHLGSGADALTFADDIERLPRQLLGDGTGIARVLRYCLPMFRKNNWQGTRLVIDLSGDGRDNVGPFPLMVRDSLVAQGITINGMAILNEDPTLAFYYESTVSGGVGSFVETAADYVDFGKAIVRKLVREISYLPIAQAPGRAGRQFAQAEPLR